jgi:LacI family transcriptional regulator
MMARGIDDSFGEEYRTLICNTDANRDRELAYAIDAFDRNADGIVIVAFQIHAGDLEGILSRGMSVVSMGEAIDDPRVDMVLKEDERGAFEATSYLLRKGHTRVGFIGGVDGPGPDRRHGYRRALKEAGLSVFPELTATGEWNRTSGSAAMRQLLSLEAPPTAVFCANDLMAIGAIDAARELRVEVPDDLAVVGFDDIEAAAMITPRLTTFANPAYESGQAAGRLLLDRIGAPEALERRTVVLHSELIERDSA